MATEGFPANTKAASDLDTAQLVKEHSHAFRNRLNTTQTDSPAIVETEKPDIDTEQLKVESGLKAPKPAPDTKQTVTEPAESPTGNIPVTPESQASVGPMNETVAGEKRSIDSTVTPTPVRAGDEEQQKPGLSDEPDTKKLKTDEEPATESNGTVVAPSTENAGQKKASRSKKEKIKDVVNKVIPGDGIGSRTRSRTKGA